MSCRYREFCSGKAGARPTKAGDPLSRVPWSTSSLSRVLFHLEVALDAAAVIPLGRPLPDASSSLPADSSESPSTALPACASRAARPLMWPCSRWGLPCRFRYRRRGGLLPRRFTLACRLHSFPSGRGRWSLLCCTFLRVPATGRYPASCSMELGLSSRRASGPFGPWFTAGDRLFGIDGAQGDTGSLAPQWGACVS